MTTGKYKPAEVIDLKQYPQEFAPGIHSFGADGAIVVEPGQGEISSKQNLFAPLLHTNPVYVLVNLDTNSSLLICPHQHTDLTIKNDDDELSRVDRYQAFASQPGKKVALPICSEQGPGALPWVTAQLGKDGIGQLPTLEVDTGRNFWSVLYKPTSRKLLIDTDRKELQVFTPFPKIDLERARDPEPLEARVKDGDRRGRKIEHAIASLTGAIHESNHLSFARVMKDVKGFTTWTILSEKLTERDNGQNPLMQMYGRERQYSYNYDEPYNESHLRFLKAVAEHCTTNATRSQCIEALCELGSRMPGFRFNQNERDMAIAHEAVGVAHQLQEQLSAEYAKSGHGKRLFKMIEDAAATVQEKLTALDISLPEPKGRADRKPWTAALGDRADKGLS